MADFKIKSFSFDATTVEFVALSDKAKALFAEMFGAGAQSAELYKSRAFDFERFCVQKGLVLE